MQRAILAIVLSCFNLADTSFAWENRDIGAVGSHGSIEVSGDVYTIEANGGDIWGSSDAFHYMYIPMSGDGDMVARVRSMENSNSWAKAGVMIRGTLDASSAHAMMIVTPGNGAAFQWRTSSQAGSDSSHGNAITAPYWVKIERIGDTIIGYHSPDGNNWTQQGSDAFSMGSDAYIGLCVTSHTDGVLCTAEFDSVGGSAVGGAWRATNLTPPNGARHIEPAGTTLSWEPCPKPPGPVVRYDVYFSDNAQWIGQPMSFLCSVAADDPLECFVGPLAAGTKYYWRVDSVIDEAETAVGANWSLTTEVEPIDMCPTGDLTGDCRVTAEDLRALADHWLEGPDSPANLDEAQNVDMSDFGVFAENWGREVGPVVINELHCDPDVKTDLAEFVELLNVTDEALDLSGWYFSDGISFTFAPDTFVPAKGFVVVAQDAEKFEAKFGFAPTGEFARRLANEGETVCLRDAHGSKVDEVTYESGFPWPIVGGPPGKSMQLISPAMDNSLGGCWRSELPTPAWANDCLTANAAPLLRQVKHTPRQPASGQPVEITVKVTDDDGVEDVILSYQVVEPGAYITLTDPEYQTNWTQVPMYDDGTGGDIRPDDDTYTCVLPAALQVHRRLIRYRITAMDTAGKSRTGPYADDPQPNFAYFVYDGVPPWHGAIQPGVSPIIEFGTDVMRGLPVYHLISKKTSIENCTWFEKYRGSDEKWYGTLVYDGDVYDHIGYRARGGCWRYAMGKNMWKFNFNRGHRFQARDDYGKKYATKWDKINFSACIQQGNFGQRGEQGMFEALTNKLFNMVGVPASRTNWVHFRIIDEQYEDGMLNAAHPPLTNSGTQYDGDFWGVYMTLEQMDGRFLDEHDLPDGNLYKMDGAYPNGCKKNNQGPTAAPDKSDVLTFRNEYESDAGVYWWGSNVNLENYYSYYAIYHAAHHGDITSKNHYFYLNPVPTTNEWGTNHLWWQLPWDVDLTWTTYYGSVSDPFSRQGLLEHEICNIAAKNRVREICDLLFNPEQMNQLIDELGAVIGEPNEAGLSIASADRAMWDYHWVMTDRACSQGYRDRCGSNRAGQDKFYKEAEQRGHERSFAGMVQVMKDYVVQRQSHLSSVCMDPDIPREPTVSATCPPDFPINALTFATTAFEDPQGDNTFASMEWRIAEVAPWSEFGSDGGNVVLIDRDDVWKYFKGTQEPSKSQGQWRQLDFLDREWLQGQAPLGYGDYDDNTVLEDMRYNYSSVYLRHAFTISDLSDIDKLHLELYVDDGCIVWINNVEVGRYHVAAGDKRYDDTSSEGHEAGWEHFTLPRPYEDYLSEGDNIVAVHAFNRSLGNSSDFSIDLKLYYTVGDDGGGAGGRSPQHHVEPGKYEIDAVWESGEITDFNSTVTIPASVVKPGRTYRVRCRMKDNTGRWSHWSDPNQFVSGQPISVGTLENLRITELMYNPREPAASSPYNNDDFEFIELKNVGDETLDLTYVSFTDGITFSFDDSDLESLEPGGFALVVKNKAAFASRYGPELSDKIAGEYKDNEQNSLKNNGEDVHLVDYWNGTVARFGYNDSRGWPLSADGPGHSLIPLDAAVPAEPEGSLDYCGNWRASAYIDGSPGADDPKPEPTVVVNEFLAGPGATDWIELYNPTNASISLTDFYLSDDLDDLKQWPVPASAIGPGQFLSFDKPKDGLNFGLSRFGEEVVLSYLPGTSDDCIVDAIEYPGQESDVSFGRYTDGGTYWFSLSPSRDAANTQPIPHVVIDEIMYHPTDYNEEYVEIYNPTNEDVVVGNDESSLRLDGAVDYAFAADLSISADGRLIVVGFDPVAETARLHDFIAAYNANGLAAGVDIAGPWSGNLSNGGERLSLERSQAGDQPGEPLIWTIVDEVIYFDQAPWPTSPDGGGDALQRINADAYHSGNDPANWRACQPSPGR